MRQIIIFLIVLGGSLLLVRGQEQTSHVKSSVVIDTSEIYAIQPEDASYIQNQGFSPDPKRAAIYSALLPGLGQIYNKKYWKLPIIYGGIGATIYAISFNHRQYKDYFNALRDFTVLDENGDRVGDSYESYLPTGQTVDDVDAASFENGLQSTKDRYRRYRDLSIVILAGIYILNIVDANVDAHLYNFSIDDNLSMGLDVVVMDHPYDPIGPLGVKYSISF